MSDGVRVKYAWGVRWRLIASWLVVRCSPVLRPVLRLYDRALSGYSAHGYNDLTLREWWPVKWCERFGHVGPRHRVQGVPHCRFCQCAWDWNRVTYGKRVTAARRAGGEVGKLARKLRAFR